MPSELQEKIFAGAESVVGNRTQWPTGHSENVLNDSQSNSWAVAIRNVRGDGRPYIWFWHKRLGGRRFDSDYCPIARWDGQTKTWRICTNMRDFCIWHNNVARSIERRKDGKQCST